MMTTRIRRPQMKAAGSRLKAFVLENKWILLVMALLFIERFYAMYRLGITYSLGSDDVSYVISGITFKNTGAITMHGSLSAQIMPGMPVLIGLFSMVFGEGKLLWLALKLFWFVMGSFSAFFAYKIVTLYTPKWCGIVTVLGFFWPDFAWMDNLILTETPFLVLFLAMIYFTLMMGRTGKNLYFWLCMAAYMLALMFKANIAPYPVFALVYLLIVKYNFKKLMKQALVLACAVLCFVIPWSIRNYIHYDAFIPLTWGSGNPLLLGTYQGHGYPADENLDYETNVDEVVKEKFSEYYDEDGNITPDYMKRYISLESDGIKARYRLAEWAKTNPLSLIDSYLIEKPSDMIHSVFYWEELFDISADTILFWRDINWVLCILIVCAALYLKKYRSILLLLSALYLGNIYIYAMTFSYSRYAATLLPLRFIAIGIGIPLLIDLGRRLYQQVVAFRVPSAGKQATEDANSKQEALPAADEKVV